MKQYVYVKNNIYIYININNVETRWRGLHPQFSNNKRRFFGISGDGFLGFSDLPSIGIQKILRPQGFAIDKLIKGKTESYTPEVY